MKTTVTQEEMRAEIMRLYSFLVDPSERLPFDSDILFTDEFKRAALGSELSQFAGVTGRECSRRLLKQEARVWSALLATILPHLQGGNLVTFQEFVDMSPLKGQAIIPFVEKETFGWKHDFSHLEFLLEGIIKGKSSGVIHPETGVTTLNAPRLNVTFLQILASG